MNIKQYTFTDPADTEVGNQLEALANNHPFVAARLISCLEEFVLTDTDLANRVVENEQVEIYLVPPRYVLMHVPDAAALVRVDHARKGVDVVRIIAEYGGPQERVQWDEIETFARHFVT
jgi:hypothetical protein